MKKYYTIIIFVSILLVLGFILMPDSKSKDKSETETVSAQTTAERINYFALHGWETEELFSKNITIPSEFNESYEIFVQMQDKQNMPLRKYKGFEAVLYTYKVTNYSPDGKNLLAELIVCDGKAVSSIIYAEDDASYMLSVH